MDMCDGLEGSVLCWGRVNVSMHAGVGMFVGIVCLDVGVGVRVGESRGECCGVVCCGRHLLYINVITYKLINIDLLRELLL